MSRDISDIQRDIAQAALLAVRWRQCELEAFEVASSMIDPEAKRHMLLVSESYGVLADRADESKKRLVALAAEKESPDSDTRGKGADDVGQETEKPAGSQMEQPAGASGTTRYEHKPRYGDDAGWPNVVWITISILCMCGLAVLPFMR